MQKVADWINTEKLTRSQLISITLQIHPSKPDETVLWVLTRAKPTDELDTPLPTVLIKYFSFIEPFEQLANDLANFLENENRKASVISLCNVRESIAGLNHFGIFYTEGDSDLPRQRYWLEQRKYTTKWEAILPDAKDFLNDNLAPHQIVSVTTYESERVKGVSALEIDNRVNILHTSGPYDEHRPKLESSVIPESRIYNYKTFQHPLKAAENEKVQMYESILDEIIAKGVE